MKRPALFPILLTSCALAATGAYRMLQIEPYLNSTGKALLPADRGIPVGSYPVQMKLSPNGRWLIVTNAGSRQQLSVIDTATHLVASKLEFNQALSRRGKESLYWGLEFVGNNLYVSRGGQEMISVYLLGEDGALTHKYDIENQKRPDAELPNFIAGLACDGDTLYAVNNETGQSTEWRGTVSEIDVASGQSRGKVQVGGFPLSAVMTRDSAGKTKEVWVTSEQDGAVSYFHPGSRVADSIRVGANPTCMLLRGDNLYVTNSGSDTVSVVDTINHVVSKTILLRPLQLRGLPVCTPLGLDLSPDGSTLFVALADMNSVAVVDVAKGSVKGYIPVGWYPTDVKLDRNGKYLYVSNAKGAEVRIPNGKPIGKLGTYIQNIIEGTVSILSVDGVTKQLAQWTQSAYQANRLALTGDQHPRPFKNPGVKHVIYIIKENRTYDNVLGDLQGGNGDASICLFPREVTPNQHALAERFALLDNFFCCAEVSADGWNWSTAGQANEYVSRNTVVNYSGRGRDYDFEGTVNGKRPEFDDVKNVAAPPGGYIWDNCRRNRVSMRNYGFFIGPGEEETAVKKGLPREQVMAPNVKALVGVTDPSFPEFDMAFPDSDLNQSYGVKIPGELATFGASRSPNRFAEWKREFDGYVKAGNLPQFEMVRFPRDHTAGTKDGSLSPRAMVADNDYAVGEVVEAVSHSPYWKDTLICIVEDDAQNGIDHVDCHRSIAFAIGPFVKRGHDSRFYNSDGMLRTIEAILGMPPMNGFDMIADPLAVFSDKPDNIEPYVAIRPAQSISTQVSTREAYRSQDSARIKRFAEESETDVELNDILWGAIKGKATALAKRVR